MFLKKKIRKKRRGKEGSGTKQNKTCFAEKKKQKEQGILKPQTNNIRINNKSGSWGHGRGDEHDVFIV